MADEEYYSFDFYNPDGDIINLDLGECDFLSKEVTGGFTSIYFGIYATGEQRSSDKLAYYYWFKYSIKDY